ncbi:MAG: hypothetical protein HQM15_06165 [Deltaproteobacteria bacterium]|nr:hypothetical protein [Deltaproteobacteria bacterium]
MDQGKVTYPILSAWLITCLKSTFIHSEPDAGIVFQTIQYIDVPPSIDIEKIWKFVADIVLVTQAQKKKWKNLIALDQNFNGHLFINNGDPSQLSRLFEKCQEKFGGRAFFHDMKYLGNQEFDCFNIQQLLDFIRKNGVKHLYFRTSIFISHHLKLEKIYLPAVLKWAGINYTVLDCDTHNENLGGGYYTKLFLGIEDSKRFSCLPHLDKPWDDYFKIPVRYHSLNHLEPMQSEMHSLNPDFKAILTSHSRIREVIQHLKPALLLLEYSNSNNLLYDFQFLFHALYYLLHFEFNGGTIQKLELSYNLSKAYYNIVNLMKYELLENINFDGKIELFGDEGWAELFPQYYQNKYIKPLERKELIKTGDYLYLIPAFNYSYYENNPVFGEVLNMNYPYLSFPSIVQDEQTSGFKHLEFSTFEEMNQKIKGIHTILQDHQEEISTSRKQLKNFNAICTQETEEAIFSEALPNYLTYEDATQKSQQQFEKLLMPYLSENSQRIFECFERFVRKNYDNFKIQESKFAQRNYIKKLLKIM